MVEKELEQAYTLKDLALQQSGSAGEREQLRLAHNAVAAYVRSRFLSSRVTGMMHRGEPI